MKRLTAFLCTTLLLVLVLSGQSSLDASLPYDCYLPVVASSSVGFMQGAGATYHGCGCIQLAGLSWYYDWGPTPPLCDSVEAVPMIWDETVVGWDIGGDSDWLLGFNEPELESQANITPTLGAELWREMESLYSDKRLVSPAASIRWLTEWYELYNSMYGESPRLDAIAHHCYGEGTPGYAMRKCKREAESVVTWALSHDIQEVWVTEFAHLPCWPNGVDGTLSFMEGMVNYYRNHPVITRWAWFQTSYYGTERWSFGPYCNTSLVAIEDDDYYGWTEGELTPFGEAYKSLLDGGGGEE